MTMGEIRVYRRELREAAATRTYRNLMASASVGLVVLAFAFVALIVLAA